MNEYVQQVNSDSTLVSLARDGSIAIIQGVQDAAPMVWEMVRNRIMVESVVMIALPAALWLVTFVFAGVFGKEVVDKESSDDLSAGLVMTIVLALTCVGALVFAAKGIFTLFTLDYATAERIIGIMTGR